MAPQELVPFGAASGVVVRAGHMPLDRPLHLGGELGRPGRQTVRAYAPGARVSEVDVDGESLSGGKPRRVESPDRPAGRPATAATLSRWCRIKQQGLAVEESGDLLQERAAFR
ncbi:hypothetical protein ABGB14_37735 [Nonomuraea sp. B10E15]|uniref:hypothetical protein n=1 Tax=Nonomuraea sp. B10E15 TaxID=3153560 RepID=UPI00325F8142